MGLTSEQERRLDSDPTRHAHVARTVSRLRDVFDWMMKPTEQPRLVLSTQYTRYGALHPLRGTAPDAGRYTRYGALHPMRGATPDQKRCNAHGPGAAPNATSIFSDAHYPPDSASAHLPPSPWTATHYGPNCHSLAVAIHDTFTGKLQTRLFVLYQRLIHRLSF